MLLSDKIEKSVTFVLLELFLFAVYSTLAFWIVMDMQLFSIQKGIGITLTRVATLQVFLELILLLVFALFRGRVFAIYSFLLTPITLYVCYSYLSNRPLTIEEVLYVDMSGNYIPSFLVCLLSSLSASFILYKTEPER